MKKLVCRLFDFVATNPGATIEVRLCFLVVILLESAGYPVKPQTVAFLCGISVETVSEMPFVQNLNLEQGQLFTSQPALLTAGGEFEPVKRKGPGRPPGSKNSKKSNQVQSEAKIPENNKFENNNFFEFSNFSHACMHENSMYKDSSQHACGENEISENSKNPEPEIFPADWKPDPEFLEWAEKHAPSIPLEIELSKLHPYSLKNPKWRGEARDLAVKWILHAQKLQKAGRYGRNTIDAPRANETQRRGNFGSVPQSTNPWAALEREFGAEPGSIANAPSILPDIPDELLHAALAGRG